MSFPPIRPDYPRSSGQPQAGYCKNCKAPIKDESSGFCDQVGPREDWCWTKWCAKQDEKERLRKMGENMAAMSIPKDIDPFKFMDPQDIADIIKKEEP